LKQKLTKSLHTNQTRLTSTTSQIDSNTNNNNITTPNTTQIPIPKPPLLRPQTIKQRADMWVKQQTTAAPPEFITGYPVRYGTNEVQIVGECLQENGTQTPWEHPRGTFAHPGLIFFLNGPDMINKYQYGDDGSEVETRTGKGGTGGEKKKKLKAINGLGLDQNGNNILANGYSNHAVLGGRLIWGEPISVHNQLLTLQRFPEPPAEWKTRSNKGKHNLNEQNGNKDENNHQNDFILLKTANGVSTRDTSKLVVYREEYHGLFPATSPDKPSLRDANEYNELLQQYVQKDKKKIPSTDQSESPADEISQTSEILDASSLYQDKTTFDMVSVEEIQQFALQNQLSAPNDQIEEIRAELNKTYIELHNEILGNSKPFLTDLSLKQQYGYLYSSLGNILKRRFKKSLEYNWKWSNQTLSLDSIELFNQSTGNNHKLLSDGQFSEQQGFMGTLISPHFFAFHLLDYLGIISEDTSPAQPGLWANFQEKVIEIQKNKAKVEYAQYKHAGKTELLRLQQLDEANNSKTLKTEQEKAHLPIEAVSGDYDDNYSSKHNNKHLDGIDFDKMLTHDETNPQIDQHGPSPSTSSTQLSNSHPHSSNSVLKQRLMRENTQLLENQDFKNLLKQRLQIQPWHTIYQQLSSFEYHQKRPFPAPQPITTTVTTTTTTATDDGNDGNDGNDGVDGGKKTTKIVKTITTKTEEIVFDVFAKVVTEHELLRRQSYHTKIRNKLIKAEQSHSNTIKLDHKNSSQHQQIHPLDLSSSHGSSSLQKQQPYHPYLSQPSYKFDPEGTIMLSDLLRGGDMRVKIWIEGKPLVTTTITTTTQWPKSRLPVLDGDDTDDDFDIFNKTKQKEWENRKAQRKAKEMHEHEQNERAKEALSKLENDEKGLGEGIAVDGGKGQNNDAGNNTISIDDEFQYPTTNFQVTNTPLEGDDDGDDDETHRNDHHGGGGDDDDDDDDDDEDGSKLTSHNVDTPIITKTIEQVHNTIETTQQQFRQGTVYFEGFATFSSPVLNIAGLDKSQLENVLVNMQNRM
jgi:hypothetical protein